jgi:hypothetical protein
MALGTAGALALVQRVRADADALCATLNDDAVATVIHTVDEFEREIEDVFCGWGEAPGPDPGAESLAATLLTVPPQDLVPGEAMADAVKVGDNTADNDNINDDNHDDDDNDDETHSLGASESTQQVRTFAGGWRGHESWLESTRATRHVEDARILAQIEAVRRELEALDELRARMGRDEREIVEMRETSLSLPQPPRAIIPARPASTSMAVGTKDAVPGADNAGADAATAASSPRPPSGVLGIGSPARKPGPGRPGRPSVGRPSVGMPRSQLPLTSPGGPFSESEQRRLAARESSDNPAGQAANQQSSSSSSSLSSSSSSTMLSPPPPPPSSPPPSSPRSPHRRKRKSLVSPPRGSKAQRRRQLGGDSADPLAAADAAGFPVEDERLVPELRALATTKMAAAGVDVSGPVPHNIASISTASNLPPTPVALSSLSGPGSPRKPLFRLIIDAAAGTAAIRKEAQG